MSKAYPSNLTPAQWELLAPLIPQPKPGGRPRIVEMWEVINAIFGSALPGMHMAGTAGGLSQLANGLHVFSQLAPGRNMGDDS